MQYRPTRSFQKESISDYYWIIIIRINYIKFSIVYIINAMTLRIPILQQQQKLKWKKILLYWLEALLISNSYLL